MKPRSLLSALALGAVCAVLAPLTGCGTEQRGDGPESSPNGKGPTAVPQTPGASRAPAPGKGSKDPDDLNGDGYRDLLVPVPSGDTEQPGGERRLAVVHGSAKGLDPTTRTFWDRRSLGLPADDKAAGSRGTPLVEPGGRIRTVTADLDGDGFPDAVTPVFGEQVEDGDTIAPRGIPYITWGSPEGPQGKGGATPLRLPAGAARQGLDSLVRGDFDGDGHHDLAGFAKNRSSLVVLYGPVSRQGVPARTDTSLPWSDGTPVADALDPSGKSRATSLLVDETSDGEQTGNTLYRARPGTPLSGPGEKLRRGNAHAFGDFDGDGKRDVAVGDDGSRNDEPGYGTEPAGVGGTFTVHPGDGGRPVRHRLPKVPRGAGTDYGPGGYAAADPDGDGRDGLLVATYQGATFFDFPDSRDGARRTRILRQGPATANGEKTPAKWRHARPAGAGDFDGDGTDELVLDWGAGVLFGLYGEHPTHWWITRGTGTRDRTRFATTGDFAPGG
ncbi:hypothetical protein [Streptomyces cacaoi]|uniref:hypothetical protein n=1 Tax=Streptomyces cacaoi TaxID=1898 RepID=UPI003747EEBD